MEEKRTDLVLINEMAQTALKSVLPPGTTLDQAKAIIWSGQELGLQPFQALRSMAFIKGRLTMTVQLQLALAKRAGVVIDKIVDGDGFCEVTLRRGEETITTKFSLEDARRAGLIRPDSNWEKYPREMLRWRAIGSALRLLAPDIVMGLLSPEEAESLPELQITDVTEEEKAIEAEVQAHADSSAEKEEQDSATAENTVSKSQLIAMNAMLRKLGIKDEKRHVIVSKILKREISSLKELTFEEASQVITRLQKAIQKKEAKEKEEDHVSKDA